MRVPRVHGGVVLAIWVLVASLMAISPAGGAETGQADTQAGPAWSGDSFGGYAGVPDDAPDVDDPATKTETLGPIGTNDPGNEDVPGEGPATGESDEPVLVQPGEATGDSEAVLRAAMQAALAGDDAGGAATPDRRLRVIVTMNESVGLEADMTPAEIDAQRARFDAAIDDLTELLAGTGSTVDRPYEILPAAVATIDAAGLDRLLASSEVVAVNVDRALEAALDVSTGVIDSDLLNSAGVLGNNYEGSVGGAYEVAILDSGVRNDHNAFTGRIVAQACFSATSWCPNGGTSQIGGNAGTHCTYTTGAFATECEHGTHVASIAAGTSYAGGHEGVARSAGIVAVQVGHRSCSAPSYCWRYFFSDLDLALAHVVALRNGGRNIAAVNMSLGGPLSTGTCDASFPNTANLFGQLDGLQVAPVVAAGNNGSATQVTYPSCLSNAYAISASDDNDIPAGFTNSNALTSWWAPGVGINAAISTSTTGTGSKSGTSMAAPHVAGSFALLRECIGNSTDEAVASDLSATGVNITRNGVTRKRINVLDAATLNVNNNDFAFPESFFGDGPINDYDWNVCADGEVGEPGPGSIENSIWWTWTPSTTGTATISTEDSGSNVTTFDTVLSVFTGNSLGTLNLVGHDDDGGTGLRSLVTVPVNGGQTYRIRVDGFGGQNGELNLHIENGPAPSCRGSAATIVGTIGNDNIVGTPGADVIVAGDGNDVVDGGGGNDVVCGGAGNDQISGGIGNDLADGESGDDTLLLGDGDDSAFGGPGSDYLSGGQGDDFLLGNAGGGNTDDVGDVIDGDDGDDTLDGWVGDDTLRGGDDADFLLGAVGNDTLSGNAGNDQVFGGDDNDFLGGQNGNDSLFGGEGNDQLFGDFGDDTLFGDGGDDLLRGSTGVDQLNGGPGADDLQAGSGNDTVNGDAGADLVRGGGGDDSVDGGADNDTAQGGTDSDTVSGGDGNDIVTGNAHGDVLNGGAGDDQLFGGPGFDIVNGEDGNDLLRGNEGADTLNGGGGNDTLFGDNGNDFVNGDDGNDVVNGGNNADTLDGGDGADQVNGNLGNDSLNGGPGAPDACNGGGGTDTTTGGCESTINIP